MFTYVAITRSDVSFIKKLHLFLSQPQIETNGSRFLGRGVVGVGWATKLTYITVRINVFERVLSVWSLYTTVGQLYEIRSGE